MLLLYLRTDEGYEQIQSIVRGQTAEVYPQDLMRFRLPKSLLSFSRKHGTETEEYYKKGLAKLKEGYEVLEMIQTESGFKKHGNILHTNNSSD